MTICCVVVVVGDIGNHLQSMFYLLRPQDTIKVVSSPLTPSTHLVVGLHAPNLSSNAALLGNQQGAKYAHISRLFMNVCLIGERNYL